jgi:Zn-dependent protease with chaperone function
MTVVVWAFHFVVSGVYLLLSIGLFVVLLAASVVSPLVVGALLFMALREVSNEKSNLVILPVLGGVVASVLILLGTARGLVRFVMMPDPGIRNRTRVVRDTIAGVAHQLRVSPFKDCFVDHGVGAYTYLTARGKFIVLGCHLLRYLDVNEFRAILAHEYAHHLHGAMLVNRVHYWVIGWFDSFRIALMRASTTTTAKAAKRGPFEWIWNFATLAMVIELLYLVMFAGYLRLAHRAIRHTEYELYCDDIAKGTVGGPALASALDRIADLQLAYEAAVASQRPGRSNDPAALCEEIDEYFDHFRASRGPRREQSRAAWSGTHPPIALRIERAGGIASRRRSAAVWSQADSVDLLGELGAAL